MCNSRGMEHKAPELLRDWLIAEGRKSNWLASKADIDPATLSQLVNGHRCPRRDTRVRLAQITGLPIAHEEAWV